MKLIIVASMSMGWACVTVGDMREVAEITTGADANAGPRAAACADFTMTASEVESFFVRAKVISPLELHEYVFAPCFVRGKGLWRNQPVQWLIRAGDTATVTKANGQEFELADPTQREHQE